TTARERKLVFERLVAIRVPAEHHELPLPTLLPKRLLEQSRSAPLHHDPAFEIAAGAEAQIFVRGARVTIRAAVQAAPVRIHAEAKTDVGTVILREDALARVVVELEPGVGGLALGVLDAEALEAIPRIFERKPANHGPSVILNGWLVKTAGVAALQGTLLG